MFSDRSFRFAALLASLAMAGPGLADPSDECSCGNLESLQQEYKNAIYMERFMLAAAAELKAWETKEAAEKAAGRSGTDINLTSSAMLKAKAEGEVKLPFPKVNGYSGPDRVSMTVGTCAQPKDELDAMRTGSPCFAIAEATLAHEIEHQSICQKMGVKAYWDRPGSEKAREEAARYAVQKKDMQSEIFRVLEVADVRVRGEWMVTFAGNGMEVDAFYTFDSGDLTLAERSDDFLELSGNGYGTSELMSLRTSDMTCPSGGAVKEQLLGYLSTDGLTFGVNMVLDGPAASPMLNCEGQPVPFPTGQPAWGELSASLPLKVGDTEVDSTWTLQIKQFAGIMGMTLHGEPSTSVTISCTKP